VHSLIRQGGPVFDRTPFFARGPVVPFAVGPEPERMHVRCVPFPFPFPRRSPSARDLSPVARSEVCYFYRRPAVAPLPRTLLPSLLLSPSPAAVSGRLYLAAGSLPALSHAPSLPLVAPSAASAPCQFPRRHRLSSSTLRSESAAEFIAHGSPDRLGRHTPHRTARRCARRSVRNRTPAAVSGDRHNLRPPVGWHARTGTSRPEIAPRWDSER